MTKISPALLRHADPLDVPTRAAHMAELTACPMIRAAEKARIKTDFKTVT